MSRGIIAATIIAASPALAQDTIFEIDHGLWRMTNAFAVPAMQVDYSNTTTECIKPEDAQRSLAAIINELTGGEDNECTISNIRDFPGDISMDIQCTSDAGNVALRSEGHMAYEYSRTSYSGGATGEITVQGRVMPYTGRGEATRIGDC